MAPITWCQDTFHEYVVFNKHIFFILWLVLGYKLVEKTFLNILITHLTDAWGEDQYDLRRAVVVVNLFEGITAVLVPVFAYVADVYTGRFEMVVFSTIVCMNGLGLNWLAGYADHARLDFQIFYPALGLMALAGAAQKGTLQAFLGDQFGQPNIDEIQRGRYTKFWWTLVSFVAAIFVQFGPLSGLRFRKLPLVLMVVMVVFFLVFLLGIKYNMNIEHPRNRRPPSLSGLRSNLSALWVCLIILSLVSASGSTFFLLEPSKLPGHDDLFSILILDNVVRFTEFMVSETASYVVGKLRERKQYKQETMELLRIGIGTWCCVLCCIFAGVTATRRKYDTVSVYWLIPQYLLLGLMAGLAKEGLQSLYESKVSISLKRYGQPLGEFARGIGSFMSASFILVLSSTHVEWFGSDLGNSRLNDYYALLAVLSLVNLMIYCVLVFRYTGASKPVEDYDIKLE